MEIQGYDKVLILWWKKNQNQNKTLTFQCYFSILALTLMQGQATGAYPGISAPMKMPFMSIFFSILHVSEVYVVPRILLPSP